MTDTDIRPRPAGIKRVLAALGIHFPFERWFPITVKKRLLWVVVGVVFLLFAGSGGFFWVSSKPAFCKTCHIQKPYYESWKTSEHGKRGVPCLDCHVAPGFKNFAKRKFRAISEVAATITNTYDTNLRSEIPDAACLRPGCHEKRLLEGEVDFKGVSFDHKPHLTELRRGKRLRCQTCHSQIVQGAHISVTESVCFTCHFKDFKEVRTEEPIAGCTGCHEVTPETITLVTGDEFLHEDYTNRKEVKCIMCHFDNVQGDGSVPRQVCGGCHSEQERLEKYDDHVFMHETHVAEHKVECFHCHSEIRHGRDVEADGSESSCARCHVKKHDITAMLYRGEGARQVEGTPSSMWAASVQCIACHQFSTDGSEFKHGSTFMAGEASCIACHGEDMEGMLDSWKEEAEELAATARTKLKEAMADIDKMQPSPEKEKAEALLADAQYDFQFVIYGKSVHNTQYAADIVEGVISSAEAVSLLAAKKVEKGAE